MAARLAGGHPAPTGARATSRDERSPRRPAQAPDTALRPDAPDALLATKLYLPPPRPDLVRRPRLTARLSAGLRGPLTLIVAPAGFGKTTLLADWRTAPPEDAQATRIALARDSAWLALDAADNDLARFLRYLVAAL